MKILTVAAAFTAMLLGMEFAQARPQAAGAEAASASSLIEQTQYIEFGTGPRRNGWDNRGRGRWDNPGRGRPDWGRPIRPRVECRIVSRRIVDRFGRIRIVREEVCRRR